MSELVLKRDQIAELLFLKIGASKKACQAQYQSTKNQIGYFFIDDLLPENIVSEIYSVFPKPEEMVLKKSLREDKYVAAQMNLYHPILEEVIYAFQDKKIVDLIAEICELKAVVPDENLYAGGLSMMGNKQFLNPHLDNSHDKNRAFWRVLNLLFYVTPNWQESYGANLELWPDGLNAKAITIQSKCNRLVVMATHNNSLHSVSPVRFDGFRCCISNYYFSQNPLLSSDTFHVTSFRGRPENRWTDLVLKVDAYLRMSLRKVFKKGVVKNRHVYKKE